MQKTKRGKSILSLWHYNTKNVIHLSNAYNEQIINNIFNNAEISQLITWLDETIKKIIYFLEYFLMPSSLIIHTCYKYKKILLHIMNKHVKQKIKVICVFNKEREKYIALQGRSP